VPTADLQVAISYAEMAAPPICRYAAQYGQNALVVSTEILQFDVNLTSHTFSDNDVRSWVNEIKTANVLSSSDAVVFLNSSTITNITTSSQQFVQSYHWMSDIAYLYVNVSGTELKIDDTADAFALLLSHELAEMVVDPMVELGVPEVCDACAQDAPYRAFFDPNGSYISTANTFPPEFAYTLFVSAIVKPSSLATTDPVPQADCAYPPLP
jgi:hypothetical protein